MSKLSRIERETVIIYNQAEANATMTTADTVVIRNMRNLVEKDSRIISKQISSEVWEFIIPKKLVKVKLPRQMTEEQRQAASERAKVNLKRKG